MKRALSWMLALLLVTALIVPAAAADGGAAACEYTAVKYYGPLTRIEKDGKIGFADARGNVVAPCIYDKARDFSDGLAAVKLDRYWGFIDETGAEVIPAKYTEVKDCSDGVVIVTEKRTRTMYLNRDGSPTMPFTIVDQYYKIGDFTCGLAPVVREKYGFINQEGIEFPICQFSNARNFVEGFAAVSLNKWGFINTKGETISPLIYDSVKDFSDGFALVTKNYKNTYIDTNGHELFPFGKYTNIEPCSGLGFLVRRDKKWGVADTAGNEVVPCEYDAVAMISDGLFRVKLDYDTGCFDSTGATIVPCEYDAVEACSEDFLSVRYNSLYGIYSRTGAQLTPVRYNGVMPSPEGMVGVRLNGKWGFVDQTGAEAVPVVYSEIMPFSEGLAAVRQGSKWGFVDHTGTDVIPAEYDSVSSFSEGLAAVRIGSLWGYVDTSGRVVIPCRFNSAQDFRHGCAVVTADASDQSGTRKQGVIDKSGTELTPFLYDKVTILSETLASVVSNRLYGLAGLHSEPLPGSNVAYARQQRIELDGSRVDLPAYALKDANGNETNYVKLRDLASLLNGSAAQFSVGWDAAANAVTIQPKTAYAPNGSEMKTPFSGDRSYRNNTAPVRLNGADANLQGIVLTDDAGGGYTYFKLRDVGKALGFNVGWTPERGIFVESGAPYTG